MYGWEDGLYDGLDGGALTARISEEKFRECEKSASPNRRRGSAASVCACPCPWRQRWHLLNFKLQPGALNVP